MRLRSSTVYTLPEARKYSREKRYCIFENEATTVFGDYSFSDCVMTCRMASIWALCQCVPFILYKAFGEKEDKPQCTLSDMICLEKYQGICLQIFCCFNFRYLLVEKWNTLYPRDYDGDDLQKEMENSINCKQCMPTCSDTLYSVTTDYGHIAEPG